MSVEEQPEIRGGWKKPHRVRERGLGSVSKESRWSTPSFR